MEKADKYLGGASGKAVEAIKSRKTRIQEEEDKAMGKESPNRNDSVPSDGRPKQSKKWYERILGD